MKISRENIRGIVKESITDFCKKAFLNEASRKNIEKVLRDVLGRKYKNDPKKVESELKKMMAQKPRAPKHKVLDSNVGLDSICESKIDSVIKECIQDYLKK